MFRHGRSLIPVITGPAVWAVYFLAVYVGAALACAKAPDDLELIRVSFAGAGFVAAVLVSLTTALAARAWRRAARTDDRSSCDPDGVDSRRAFLSFAGLLLGSLSIVAIIFTGAPLLLAGTCR